MSTLNESATNLFSIIHDFQKQVENALPGMYVWFDQTSLHVTVRALFG